MGHYLKYWAMRKEKTKMRLRKKVIAVLLSASMVLTAGTMVPKSGKVASAATGSFDNLNQTEITAAMGAGWNLGNQLEAANSGTPSETNWGNPVIMEDLILAVKAAGFKSVRIPVSYLNMIGSDSNYTINSKWLDRVQEVVDFCIDNDLYAIINMHGDGYTSISGGWLLCGSSDQTKIKAKYEACWKQIANRFKNYDEHLIFESMNEEFDGTYGTPSTTAYANINAYNQIFVDTVRQTGGNNDKRWLLIPGWNTSIDYTAGDYGFKLPTDNYRSSSISSSEKRIMISVHYYDPWEFCGTESSDVTQWGSTVTNNSKKASWGDESYMISQFKKMHDKFVAQGYPVIIGEYGSIDKSKYDSSNTANRKEFAYKVCYYADKYDLIPVYWDNGYNGEYGFGLFDRSTYKVTQPEIISGIMEIYGKTNTSTSTSTTSTSETVLAQNTTVYESSSADWLKNAADSDVIKITYTCTEASHGGWGVLGWGASVNGNWVNGTNYNAASNATDEVTVTCTAAELKSSLNIDASANVSYISLSGWNGGKIVRLSIATKPSSGTSTETSGIDTSKSYMLKNVNSGKYLDVTGAKAVNGTNVIQYTASTAKNNNTWKFVPDGEGYYYIYSALGNGNTFLLDVDCNRSANGTNIAIWQNTYCDAQKYKLVKNSDGSYCIYTKTSNCKSVVEVVNAYTTNGANVQQWEYNGHNCQKWYLEAVN